jgi:DNA-binding CsgD family transcriptional regulator
MDYTPASWLEIWTRLVAAELRFKKAVWNDGRCIAVFRRNAPTSRHYGLTARERTVLVRTLQGERQKLIAAEAKIAASTVANSLKSARVKLGFEDRLDAAPLATLIVANGTENASPYPQRNIYSIGGGEWYMASSPRPDWSGFQEVTKSERSIALAIIEGQSNTEIAKARDTSVHTVENQVASLFRKVNASGRFDLIRVLYQDSAPNSTLMSA